MNYEKIVIFAFKNNCSTGVRVELKIMNRFSDSLKFPIIQYNKN